MNWGPLITAMATPFRQDGAVDYDRAAELARRLVDGGSTGIVVAGTTGESPTLSDEEKLQLLRVVKDAVAGRAAVLAGTGTYDTAHSVHLSQQAQRLGADGLLVVVPYYNRPTQEGLYRHFKAVAESTDLPVLMYNIPGRTGTNMLPETVARLSEVRNVAGIKEASGSLDQVSEIRRRTPEQFLIYSGDDSLTLPYLSVGAVGIVSVASHLVGREIREMILHFQAGRVEDARRIHLKLFPLFRALFVAPNPVPLKAALELAGFPVGKPRLPLVEATEKEREQIAAAMREAMGVPVG
ncbi:MAG: 4-hydroxy-tetrahydrodipicolinate synthase [Armatimonadota bacterium]|nr:4-hydroxy-tetrahydrodipicolinate synthase [Armatimonadota bacterium]MDR5690335.1 4-hydroxy-tetrahydrodipicolinate synthase [Armatimonadota bacterium]MDR7387040.1 4-hydroxy-tetrahydrodipicolinate synthase [Armatimonadota bacterium]MDR7390179.1 4-hydroxy-tetrahydrodipicolinate synthase [Armatimonadota bacterium]MDR7391367.1 4-hydroxy-tetrahydrodipicolinate synthase [Armatimonadota bacterium]